MRLSVDFNDPGGMHVHVEAGLASERASAAKISRWIIRMSRLIVQMLLCVQILELDK